MSQYRRQHFVYIKGTGDLATEKVIIYIYKTNLLVTFLNEVLGACQNAGMHVVVTVCDMGANSVKALKLLAATRQKPFFKFQNQDIVTVYDPPHFLKCTRNLFLNCKVQFESELMCNQLPVIAKWQHILSA